MDEETRTVSLDIRFKPSELERIRRLADGQELKAGTWARRWVLRGLDEEENAQRPR